MYVGYMIHILNHKKYAALPCVYFYNGEFYVILNLDTPAQYGPVSLLTRYVTSDRYLHTLEAFSNLFPCFKSFVMDEENNLLTLTREDLRYLL